MDALTEQFSRDEYTWPQSSTDNKLHQRSCKHKAHTPLNSGISINNSPSKRRDDCFCLTDPAALSANSYRFNFQEVRWAWSSLKLHQQNEFRLVRPSATANVAWWLDFRVMEVSVVSLDSFDVCWVSGAAAVWKVCKITPG